MASPVVDFGYLLGTAAPSEIRRTRPIKQYSHPVLSHHTGARRQYFIAPKESKAPKFPKEVVVFTQPLEPVSVNYSPIYNRAPYASAVISYLASHPGPQGELAIRSVLPAGVAFRDLMYRLVKSGKVIKGDSGAYSLEGTK